MNKKFIALVLIVISVLTTVSVPAFAVTETPDVMDEAFLDNFATTTQYISTANASHKTLNGGEYGKLWRSKDAAETSVVYDVSGKDLKSITVVGAIGRDAIPTGGEHLIYVSADNVTYSAEPLEYIIKSLGKSVYEANGYEFYEYVATDIPENTNYIKVVIPVAGAAWENPLYRVGYKYTLPMNISDGDVLLAGDVELVAKTNLTDTVTGLVFYNGDEVLCHTGNAGNGVWRGTWTATEGIYNVYAVATYEKANGVTGKKYSDPVNVTVIPSYTTEAIAGKGMDDILGPNGGKFAYDSAAGTYYQVSAAVQDIPNLNLDEGKYEFSLKIKLSGYKTVIRNFIFWDKSGDGTRLCRPIALQPYKPFSYQSAKDYQPYYSPTSQTYINNNVICYGDVWYDVKLVIDTVSMTEDVYVNGHRINDEPIDINCAGGDMDGIAKITLKKEGTDWNRIDYKEFKVSKVVTDASVKYSNLEAYVGGEKVADTKYIPADVTEFKFSCANWNESAVVKCGDSVVTASYADGVVTLPVSGLAESTVYSVTVDDEKIFDFKTAANEVDINEFCYTDIENTAGLVAGNEVHGTVKLINKAGKDEDFNFVLALYNGNVLEKIEVVDEFVDVDDAEKSISVALTLPEGFSKDTYELKFFAFDNMNNLKPLK